jgi:hypothetical protein
MSTENKRVCSKTGAVVYKPTQEHKVAQLQKDMEELKKQNAELLKLLTKKK